MRGLFALVALLAAGAAHADPRGDALAADAKSRYDAEEYIAARELAEEAIARNAGNFRAHAVLGLVMRDAEGNLARAMYELGRARELYETRYAGSLDTDWRFHASLLDDIQRAAGDAEEYESQLEMIAYYNARYDPDIVAGQAWPLMKLGRLDEARAIVAEALTSEDEAERSVAYNVRCAIEAETGERRDAYLACLAALEAERLNPEPDVTVDAFNAATAARGMLRFEEAERLAQEANTSIMVSTANPWTLLATQYVSEGRGEDAVRALRMMQAWRAHQLPALRDQDRAETDAIFAMVMLAAGEPELGMALISRAIAFPDRRAMTSGSADQARATSALYRIALRRSAAERGRERRATQGVFSRLGGRLASLGPDTTAWQDAATVEAAMADRGRLRRTARVYLSGGLDVPAWVLGDLIPVLGVGVMTVAVAQAREEEPEAVMIPYYDALDAELAWWRGDETGCRGAVADALGALPEREVILRARLEALAADAAWRQGDEQESLLLFSEVLRADPGVLRHLGIRLPSRVTGSADVAVSDAVVMLGRSPRLRAGAAAFEVAVTAPSGTLQVCLNAPDGRVLRCVTEPDPPAVADGEEPAPWTPWDRAAATVDGFHRRAFSLTTGVSARELRSLDGTDALNTQAAREKMSGLLEQLTAPAP